jgi:ketosteroid isomerase-like protein
MFGVTSARQIDINTTDYGAGGDVAYAIGTYSFSYETEGETKTDEGKFLTVSKLTGDGWRITAHSWSSNLPLE